MGMILRVVPNRGRIGNCMRTIYLTTGTDRAKWGAMRREWIAVVVLVEYLGLIMSPKRWRKQRGLFGLMRQAVPPGYRLVVPS